MTSEATHKFRQQLRRKKHLRELVKLVLLVILLSAYTLLGAKLFQSIEQQNEEKSRHHLLTAKQELFQQITTGLDSEVDRQNWTKMAEKLISYYLEDLTESIRSSNVILDVTVNGTSAVKWDFWNSLLYAGTVYTTIGYGYLVPTTDQGKVATIVYGILGIPLCLLLLAELGRLISKGIRNLIRSLKKCYYTQRLTKQEMKELWPPNTEVEMVTGLSSLIVWSIMCVLYVIFGAWMYRSWEPGWSYLDAVYFIFITTSTIGFGDLLPSKSEMFVISSIYVFIGLSLISTGLNILQDILESNLGNIRNTLNHGLGIHTSIHEETKHSAHSPKESKKEHRVTGSEPQQTISKAFNDQQTANVGPVDDIVAQALRELVTEYDTIDASKSTEILSEAKSNNTTDEIKCTPRDVTIEATIFL